MLTVTKSAASGEEIPAVGGRVPSVPYTLASSAVV
jgi:hypothetical protein